MNFEKAKLSQFQKKDILPALITILEAVSGEKYVCKYANKMRDNDEYSPLIISYNVTYIAPKELDDNFYHISDNGNTKVTYPISKREKIVFINDDCINDGVISFYDTEGNRSVEEGTNSCVYTFVDCLMEYRRENGEKEMGYNEIMEKALQFVEKYKPIQENDIAKQKRK